MARNGILVVGSANMDLVVTTRRFPSPGETVFGGSFNMFPGGKGANQAVACAKLGGRVHFVGKMGRDVFREKLSAAMRRDGVRLDGLAVEASSPTGTALITVDGGGQNEIVVVSGANMALTSRDIDRVESLFARAGILLVQLEVPIPTVQRSVELARRHGLTVILNPAPARTLPLSLLRKVDFLTPNETELQTLTGIRITGPRSAKRAARKLLGKGVGNVLVTLGPKGCLAVRPVGSRLFPARAVRPVDTTAAGDAFNGALAHALARNLSLDDAVVFANDVASLSVTRMGAQSSMPTMRELRSFRAKGRRA